MSESTKATIEILEHYHHNGGFYEIPVEVINTVEQELEEQEKEIERLNKELENLEKLNNANYQSFIEVNKIINELEKCVQNYIYAIEPRGCSINYNCEYDSEEDYINAMKEQSKLNTFKYILNKIKELKGEDKE